MNHRNSVNFQEIALEVIVSSVAGLQSIKNELIFHAEATVAKYT